MAPSGNREQSPIYQRPADLLQDLIRFKTVNPPGNEAACVNYIGDLLGRAGISPNLVSRIAVSSP